MAASRNRRGGLFGAQAQEFLLKHVAPHLPVVGPMFGVARTVQSAHDALAKRREPVRAAPRATVAPQGASRKPQPKAPAPRAAQARPVAPEGGALQSAIQISSRAFVPGLTSILPRTASVDAFDEGMLSGLLLGGANEVSAALATAPVLIREGLGPARDYYSRRLAAEDAKDAALRKGHPGFWYPGLALGAVVPTVVLRKAPVTPGRTVIRDGLQGAAAGFLSTDGDAGERGRAALGGALAGAGLSWAAPSLARTVAPKAASKHNYWDEIATPEMAARLVQAYKGMGHHFSPRRFLEKIGAPKWIVDSPFNVLKPRGMTTGDFYRLHFLVDPKARSFRVGKAYGGKSWVGKKFGLETYDRLGRVVEGAPDALRQTVGFGTAAGGGLLYGLPPDEE